MKLTELRPGQQAIVSQFTNSEISLKLLEMGCIPGEKVLVVQVAPLGDPISIMISGYSLSLRLNEAENIIVDLIN